MVALVASSLRAISRWRFRMCSFLFTLLTKVIYGCDMIRSKTHIKRKRADYRKIYSQLINKLYQVRATAAAASMSPTTFDTPILHLYGFPGSRPEKSSRVDRAPSSSNVRNLKPLSEDLAINDHGPIDQIQNARIPLACRA
jgi:hypothetical protein